MISLIFRRRLFALLCVLAATLAATVAAHAERRVALVVGNAAYASTTQLRNPVNDATDVAAKLTELGFEVVLGVDLTVSKTDDLREEFRRKLAGADVALFYFAGHGVQFHERNYMLPVDARLANDYAIKRETTSIDEIMQEMQSLAQTSLIFLDACRNNPLADKLARAMPNRDAKAGERGLARMTPSANTNTLIVFATAPSSVAEDGVGRNSPFTEAFLRHVDQPVDVEVMLKRVSRDVSDATAKRQQPERSSRLKSDFQFAKSAPEKGIMVARPPAAISREQVALWEVIKNSTDPEAFKAFVDKYPGAALANLARQRLVDLQQSKAGRAKTAAVEPDPELECTEALTGALDEQKRFIAKFPTHRCSDQIRRMIRMRADSALWDRTAKSASIAEFRMYLEAFPDGVYVAPAKDRIANLEAVEKGRNTITRTPDPSVNNPTGAIGNSFVQPPAPPVPTAQFTRHRNSWVDGDGFHNEFGGNYESCENLCRETASCRMFEFYFGKETRATKCSLFDHKKIQRDASTDAHVGVRR